MKKVLAVFDFDGTITRRDSLFPFLIYVFGWTRTLFKLLWISPIIACFPLGILSRQRAKETVLTHFFGGWALDDLKRLGKAFSEEILPHEARIEALDRIAWHRLQGHTLILISASVQIYLEPWGHQMGFDHIFTSMLEAVDGHVTGKLAGPNCRGKEKVQRLQQNVGDLSQYEIYAYGDSDGDKELLAVADHAYYKNMPLD